MKRFIAVVLGCACVLGLVSCGRTVHKTAEETGAGSSEGGEFIPMVMVDGTLYLGTGHESTVEARCGVMDGEITSTVEGNETPTQDDQSNFGAGYGYQYGPRKGTIEIYMNDKWCVFTEEQGSESGELLIEPGE